MDIYFLENSIPFNGEDLNNEKISGTEKWGYTTFLIIISLGSIHVD